MTHLAKTAERGLFDMLFISDGNGVQQMDWPDLFEANCLTSKPAVFEPVTVLSALAMHTQNIGLLATATTTYEEPFLLARKFASLDHISPWPGLLEHRDKLECARFPEFRQG